ncbi:MAG: YdcF family protein [Verrucomicrobiales bacterium]|nr:YdcF family protein [Verrucomicrobiales bacterium]
MFWIKKVVSMFLDPVPVVLVMMVVGWLCLFWSRRVWRDMAEVVEGTVAADYSVAKKKGRYSGLGMLLIFLAACLLYFCSTGWVANKLFYALEKQYPPLQLEDEEVLKLRPEFIVVLSGSHVYFPERPITSRLAGATSARLMEGLRIHQSFPASKMVMTGGVMEKGWPSVASEMGEMAKILGLSGEAILEETSRDTKENASKLKNILLGKSFILVTSAYHMPRAMALFRGQGLKPIAACADLKRWPRNNFKYDQLIPSSKNLNYVGVALHEYVGLLWAGLRGQLGEDAK